MSLGSVLYIAWQHGRPSDSTALIKAKRLAQLPSASSGVRVLVDPRQCLGAADLYRGPFLDGVYLKGADEFERWTAVRRDEYARQLAAALESLAEATEPAGDWVRAAEWWQRVASIDPYNARLAARTMRALAAAGDRAGAIRHGGRQTERLRTDLGSRAGPGDPGADGGVNQLGRQSRRRQLRPADPMVLPGIDQNSIDGTA